MIGTSRKYENKIIKDFNIILNDHVANLRDLLIFSVYWSKAESVSTDHTAGM